jgi:hypothetical protein
MMRAKLEGWFSIAVLICGAAGACDARHDIGGVEQPTSDAAAAGGGGATGSTDAAFPPPVDAGSVGQGGARMVGPLGSSSSWTGYVENYQFLSSSDTIKFSFASDAAGLSEGTVVFGMGTPPPPATDPNAGYPPGFSNTMPPLLGQLWEGFPYPMHNGVLTGRRLKFAVSWADLWAGWCALQTPAADGSGNCLPNWGGMEIDGVCSQRNPQTGQVVVVDCGKFFLCDLDRPCTCSGTTCAVSPDWASVTFDMALTGDVDFDGSVAGLGNTNNVHFTKDP